jgi:hypothetical protein
MSGVITRNSHPKAQWEGIKAWWGREYGKHPKFHTEMFEIDSSRKAYEEDVEVTGFGLAPVKTEGGGFSYDSEAQGAVKRYTNVAYGLGYICTYEEGKDGLYETVSRRRTTALAFSMETTRQIICAGVWNNGFDSGFPGGDGVEFFSTAHPTVNGTQSNELNPAADFSESAAEDMIIMISDADNSRGLPIALRPVDIAGPNALMFEMTRVLKSEQQSGTANNDTNAIRTMGLLGKKPIINPYFTDADAWFIRTNAPNGTKYYNREEVSFDQDNDFDTKNLKAAAYMRFVAGWTDWRGWFGSQGA